MFLQTTVTWQQTVCQWCSVISASVFRSCVFMYTVLFLLLWTWSGSSPKPNAIRDQLYFPSWIHSCCTSKGVFEYSYKKVTFFIAEKENTLLTSCWTDESSLRNWLPGVDWTSHLNAKKHGNIKWRTICKFIRHRFIYIFLYCSYILCIE